MKSYQKIVVFLVIVAALICNVQSQMIEVEEGYCKTISCPANHGISIDSSYWNFKYWSFKNFLLPINWRSIPLPLFYTTAFASGACSYDVKEKIREICQGRNECTLTPTTDLLGGCNYNKYLRVWYWCQPCVTHRKRRGVNFIGRCDFTATLPPRAINCPNGHFIAKHVCNHCVDSSDSASMFAFQAANVRLHGYTVSTTYNTVFVAPNMIYIQNGDKCSFNSYAPKYDCQLNSTTRHWDCFRMGNVIATHSTITGHYSPQLDV